MKTVTDFPYDIKEDPHMVIPMADGCRLSARVWRPVGAGPVPAILEFLPYRKRDGTVVRDALTHPWFAGHGYAAVRVDMRGNGDSEGRMADEYSAQELSDACEVIAWLAAQPWSSGTVGMMGISWGGFNGLQVAALRPSALKAVITLCSSVDRYADDIHYKGGCQLIENFGWAANMLSYSSRPPDPALVGDEWRQMWLGRLEAQPYLLPVWAGHPLRDAYWEHGSVCEDYNAIEAAVLSIGGWHDGYRNTVSHLVTNLKAPVKGIVGAWIHKYPHFAGPQPAIGFLQEAKRWWDRWLKGDDTGVEDDPAYRAWLMDHVPPARWHDDRPGRWIAEDVWPSPDIAEQVLYLTADGLALAPAAFELSVQSAQDCGAEAGEYFPFAFGDELPGEQSGDDAGSLCFDGAVAEADMDIVGAPVLRFAASADRTTGQVIVRLCDLAPDGTSALITHGCLNLTHRVSHAVPSPLVPGEVFEASVTLDQIAYRLAKGHRLRVAISTAYWPYVWPSPEATKVRFSQGALTLPVRPTALGDEWEFEPAEGAAPWKAEALRLDAYDRRVVKRDGWTITEIDIDNGENRDLEHGLISGSWTTERWFVRSDDPTSAKGEIVWEQTGGRAGAMWRTHVEASMWCDEGAYFSRATLQAFDNDELVFERVFEDAIPRKLV